jgi:hypothetical protein
MNSQLVVRAWVYVTIGCMQLQAEWLIFLFHLARIPRIIVGTNPLKPHFAGPKPDGAVADRS